MIPCTKIVNVNVTVRPEPFTWPVEYIILRDKTRKEVLAVARQNPRVFVFPFATGKVEDVPDYRWLKRTGDESRSYIVMPMYVGNLTPVEDAIQTIVKGSLGMDATERKP